MGRPFKVCERVYMVGVFVVLLLLGSWLLNMAIYFTTNVFAQIPNILR
jgi:flagellar biosynthetic protein FliQ